MSVSARTFQLLYIIRERAQKDLPTKLEDFHDFIAERRASTSSIYDRAYISPSAIQDLVHRMSTTEKLLTIEGRNYTFTPLGSQMADLLDGIDACSTRFIDGYKELVVYAVLQQRVRLGQPPANQRDVAAIANISLDSARRGLATLIEQDHVVEDKAGRSNVYILTSPPVVVNTPQGQSTAVTTSDTIREALEGIDDTDIIPGPALTEIPDDLPLSVHAILKDNKPEPVEKVPVPATADNGVVKTPWDDVPDEVLEGYLTLAKAVGMSLTDYLSHLLDLQQSKVRQVLFAS